MKIVELKGNSEQMLLTNKEAMELVEAWENKEVYACERTGDFIDTTMVSRIKRTRYGENKIYLTVDKGNGHITKYLKKGDDFFMIGPEDLLIEVKKDKETGEIPLWYQENLYEEEEYFNTPPKERQKLLPYKNLLNEIKKIDGGKNNL